MTVRTVTGIISRVDSKPFADRRTGKDIFLHSFQLEGSNQWFRTGQITIPAGVGQNVKFVADGANVDMQTFETTANVVSQAPTVANEASPAAASRSGPVKGGRPGVGKDDYWSNKEARDLVKEERYKAVSEPRMALSVAVEAAATVVSAAIAKDALSFGNAAKAKKLGLLSDYVKEIALDLATFIHDAPSQLANYKPMDETKAEVLTNVGEE